MKLFSIVRPSAARLLLIKHSAPFRTQFTWSIVLSGVAAVVLVGWIAAERIRPAYVIFCSILAVLVLIVAARAAEVRKAAGKDESILFDREANAILQNGQPVALLTDVDHVLVRHVLPDESPNADPVEYAIVVTLQDSRKIPIAETHGLPGCKDEIEKAANEIAEYAGVRVQVGERRQTEYWMDMA